MAAADLLVPGIGEADRAAPSVTSASDVLTARIKSWAWTPADLRLVPTTCRRFGSVKLAGYGLGFERLLMYMSPASPNIPPMSSRSPRTCGGFLLQPISLHRCCNGFRLTKGSSHFRQEPSAYHIWVSEIMLQQTRVSRGHPVLQPLIIAALPTPADLAVL